VSKYGRSQGEWDDLTKAGLTFLIEQAKLQRTTTYSELNDTLRRRTGHRPFDFDLESERAAMGELLGLIVDQNRPTTHLMISALVIYLNENDAGPGFYTFAQQLGDLTPNASKSQKERFWVKQVADLHAYYKN
jgi:hypothetical protein